MAQMADFNWSIEAAIATGGVRPCCFIHISVLCYLEFPKVSGIANPTSSLNHGTIEGDVVGGIIGAALIAGVGLWFAFCHRHARSVPSVPVNEDEEMMQPPFQQAKIYVSVYSLFPLFQPL
jgi:hypothetical protein